MKKKEAEQRNKNSSIELAPRMETQKVAEEENDSIELAPSIDTHTKEVRVGGGGGAAPPPALPDWHDLADPMRVTVCIFFIFYFIFIFK